MKNKDIFGEIVAYYTKHRDELKNEKYQEYLRKTLFSETDSKQSVSMFFYALEELANYDGPLPVYECLLFREEKPIVQKLNGEELLLDLTEHTSIRKCLRIIAYFCLRKGNPNFHKFISFCSHHIFMHEIEELKQEQITETAARLCKRNNLDVVKEANKEMAQQVVRMREVYYIIDKEVISNGIQVALILPIINYVSEIDDLRFDLEPFFNDKRLDWFDWEHIEGFVSNFIEKMYVKHKTMGYGVTARYHAREKTIDVLFLNDEPGEMKSLMFPEEWDNGLVDFVSRQEYNVAEKEREAYYKKLLIGKRVYYFDSEYSVEEDKVIDEVECEGIVVDYIIDQIMIERVSPKKEGNLFSKYRCFKYPPLIRNRIQVVMEESKITCEKGKRMLKFLKDVGIKETTIKTMGEMYSEATCYNLNSLEYEVKKIIKYFRKIGIEDIDILLEDNLNVFFLPYEEVVEAFNKKGEEISAAAVNYDYHLIDKIIFRED